MPKYISPVINPRIKRVKKSLPILKSIITEENFAPFSGYFPEDEVKNESAISVLENISTPRKRGRRIKKNK